nr:hypothetical protein [Catenibacterium mitsuokai]
MKRRINIPHEPVISQEPLKEEKIEWTFFIKDAKHSLGSNHYEFEFPPQWRTLENCELSIGVRAIYLRKCTRKIFYGKTNLWTKQEDKFLWGIQSHDHYLDPLILQTDDTLQKLVDQLNYDIKRTIPYHNAYQYSWIHKIPKYHDCFRWELNDHTIEVNEHHEDWTKEMKEGTHQQLLEIVGFLDNPRCEDFRQVLCISENEIHLILPIKRKVWNRRDELLIKASFVNQSNHHLGHTNSQFYPMKIYPISNKDVNFWIETYNLSDTDIVELPPDGRDSLVLECVLFIKHK